MKRLINLTILSIFVFFLFSYFNQNKEIISFFYKINIWYIFLFLNLAILNFIFRTFFNIYIFKSIGISVSVRESFDLVLKNTIGNLLGPLKAGAGHNLHYMYKNYNLSIFFLPRLFDHAKFLKLVCHLSLSVQMIY